MRTAVTLDKDLEPLIRAAMHRTRRSFKETVDAALVARETIGPPRRRLAVIRRLGIVGLQQQVDVRNDHVRRYPRGGCTRLADDLEIEAVLLDMTRIQVPASLERIGMAGNLVTDVQIALSAREHGAVVHTPDSDFVRFPGVRWHKPLTGAGGRGPQAVEA